MSERFVHYRSADDWGDHFICGEPLFIENPAIFVSRPSSNRVDLVSCPGCRAIIVGPEMIEVRAKILALEKRLEEITAI